MRRAWRLEVSADDAKSACLVVFLFGGNPRIKTTLRGLGNSVRLRGLCNASPDFNRRRVTNGANILNQFPRASQWRN